VLHIKEHLKDETDGASVRHIRSHIFELTEFLTDILKIESLGARFPHRVGFHNSCHGQRGLHLSSMSERMLPSFSKPARLLSMVEGLEVVMPVRVDECCGFGGTFSVFEEAVSVRMGKDRIEEHGANDVEYITGVDTSCLMHLEGLLRRQGSPVKTIHIAEILNSVS
jgi:L-lactate dehydrogenase complex protein LldE